MAAATDGRWGVARLELSRFLLLAAAPTLTIVALFQLHPWPTPMKQQADLLSWAPTATYLAAGALGVFVLPWTRTATTPRMADAHGWSRIALWSLPTGIVYGLMDLAINRLTPWGAHLAAVDRRNGLNTAFVNVRPPWSLPHYLHASVISECAFRLAPILILSWLMGRLLRGRGEGAIYWSVAVFAALIEPLEKAVFLRKWSLFGDQPVEQLMNLEAVAWQLVYALLLRRLGWPAPILARFGYYLVVRAFIQ